LCAKTGLMHRSKSALLNHVVSDCGYVGGTRIGDFEIEGRDVLVGGCTGRGRRLIISASNSTAAIPMIKSANAAIYYLYGDNRTITLCDHIGVPVGVKGEIFQSKLVNKDYADDERGRFCTARAVQQVSRFISGDCEPNDGPLRYPRGRNGW